jgi:hypothetical protein
MASDNSTVRKAPERVDLEKKYGTVACKGLLNAAELAKRKKDIPNSKGFASQTERKHVDKKF